MMRLPYAAFLSECVTCTIVVPSLFRLLEQLHDFLALARVQIAGRLVRQNQFRTGDDGARNTDELLLSARELARIEILFPDDVETVERVGDHRGAFLFSDVPIGKRDVEILVNGQVIEQMILLKDEADLLVPQRAARIRFHAHGWRSPRRNTRPSRRGRASRGRAGAMISPRPTVP